MENFFTPASQLPPGAGFGLYGREHICWLVICLAAGTALCLTYRRCGVHGRARVRLSVGLAALLCEALKEANLIVQGEPILYYLPLHLCGLAVFFTLWHSIRPNATAGELLYSSCMPGALFAILFPDWTACAAFSFHSILGFTVHMLLVVYPLMQVLGGDLRPRAARLPRCLLILLCLAGAVYVFDRIFRVNYMFLLVPAAGSPLEWFEGVLGNPGYLLGYVPMLALVWVALYAPFTLRAGGKAC